MCVCFLLKDYQEFVREDIQNIWLGDDVLEFRLGQIQRGELPFRIDRRLIKHP